MLRKLWRSQAGAAGVEFALIGPLFAIVLMGTYDFARLFWNQNILELAIQQTGRYALANPSLGNTNFQTYCNNLLTSYGSVVDGITGMSISCTSGNTTHTDGDNVKTTYAQITADGHFKFSVWCPSGVCGILAMDAKAIVPISTCVVGTGC